MSWVLLDDDFQNNPKVLKAGRNAAYVFVCGLCYCRKYHTGGVIPPEAFARIGATKAVIDALISSGLWHAAEGGMHVNGYDSLYADEDAKAKKDAKTQQVSPELSLVRSRSGRQGGLAKASKFATFAMAKEGTERISTSDHLLEEKKREADFSTFWATYPRKDGKRAAMEQWNKLKPSVEVQRSIAADIDRRKQSQSWQKDNGQFIPHARTYLHQRRWEDGFEEPAVTNTIQVMRGARPQPVTGCRYGHTPPCMTASECTEKMLADARAARGNAS